MFGILKVGQQHEHLIIIIIVVKDVLMAVMFADQVQESLTKRNEWDGFGEKWRTRPNPWKNRLDW